MLRTAHGARALVQIDLTLPSRRFGHVICFDDTGATVVVSPDADGVTVQAPAPVEAIVDAVGQYFGTSTLRAVPFSVELQASAAWLFAAAVDLERRRTFVALSGTAEAGPAAFDAPTLAHALERSAPDFHSLTSFVAAAMGRPPGLDAWAVEAAFRALLGAGLVAGGAAGYGLTGDSLELARRFLLPEVMLRVQLARALATGELERSTLWFVQAGVHDVLMAEVAADTLSLRTLSAASALEAVRQLAEDPDLASGAPGDAARGTQGTQLMPAFPGS